MTNASLNMRLLESFPELKEPFDEYVSWQDGPETGCFLTFEDVLVPFILIAIEADQKEQLERISNFLESLYVDGDEYTQNVVYVGVLEAIKAEADYKKVASMLKPHTLSAFLEIQL